MTESGIEREPFMSTHGEIGAATGSDIRNLKNRHEGESASILCPGISLEYLDYTRLKGTIRIGVNRSIKLHDLDYCVVRDYKKIDSVSYMISRRPDCEFVLDTDAIRYIQESPTETYLFGESISDRYAKSKAVYSDDFGMSSMAYSIRLCSVMGISKISLYGADFYYTKNKTHAFDIGSRYEGREFWDLGEGRLTNEYLEGLRIEVEELYGSLSDINITNMSKESRLKCFKKQVA